MHVGSVEIVGLHFASVHSVYPAEHIGGLKPTLQAVRSDSALGCASAHRWNCCPAPSARPAR